MSYEFEYEEPLGANNNEEQPKEDIDHSVVNGDINGITNGAPHTYKKKDGILNKLKKRFSSKKKSQESSSTNAGDPQLLTNSPSKSATLPSDEVTQRVSRKQGFWRRSFGAGRKSKCTSMYVPNDIDENSELKSSPLRTRCSSTSKLHHNASDEAVLREKNGDVQLKKRQSHQAILMPPPRNWYLASFGWYWGPLPRPAATSMLADQDEGTFLVRDSEREFNRFTLSFRAKNQTLHHRIQCNADGQYAFIAGESFESVPDLIHNAINCSRLGTYCMSKSAEGEGEQYSVRLLYPLSRFEKVRSLQYLCRFLIRNYIKFDQLDQLFLPADSLAYIKADGYYS